MTEWYNITKLGESCDDSTHCVHCKKDGCCDACDTVEGKWQTAVSEYASTCDGPCAMQTDLGLLAMDTITQLGYCEKSIPKLSHLIQKRLEIKFPNQLPRSRAAGYGYESSYSKQ